MQNFLLTGIPTFRANKTAQKCNENGPQTALNSHPAFLSRAVACNLFSNYFWQALRPVHDPLQWNLFKKSAARETSYNNL